MANAFVREPVVNGDDDAWAPYLLAAVRRDEGQLSCELYNDSGALKLSKGRIGINDGTNRGCIEIDTIATLSLVGLTNSRWAQIEATVSGAAVTLSITSIAAGTDESTIPAAIKAAYDYEKQGYYVTATKRLLGITFIRTGTLGRIVNCESGRFGFKNIRIDEYQDGSGNRSYKYVAWERFAHSAAWNMDSTALITITPTFAITTPRKINAFIQSAGASKNPLDFSTGDPPVPSGGIHISGANLEAERDTGGYFDSATFNSSTVYVTIEYET